MKEQKKSNSLILEIVKFIKENLSLLIILPPLFGGIWQAIELMSISISFLRFFSVSQLVADGILILIIFTLIFGTVSIIPLYYHWVIPTSDNYDKIKEEINLNVHQNKADKVSLVDKNPILFFIIFYSAILLITFCLGNYKVSNINELLIFTIFGFILIYILQKLYFNERKLTKDNKKSIYLGSLFVFIVMFLYVFLFFRHIHNLFLLPKNIVNIEKLNNKIRIENPNENLKILYTNDKYIFLELENKKSKKTKILIKPFEKLFEDK